jgi:ATP-dependent Lhr-like helicase
MSRSGRGSTCVNDPPSVAAFLQRIGRTGRRAGASRNCLLLALDSGSLL